MDGFRRWWYDLGERGRIFASLSALMVVGCLWIYGAGHARYGLFDVDEAIFTQATVEMRHKNEGISGLAMPTYNSEPRYHKPPLIYWVQDALMGVFGEDSLFAARLPSAFGALMCVLMLGAAIYRWTRDMRWALASAAMLAFNLSFVVIGRAATADGLLNMFSLALTLWVVEVMFADKRTTKRRTWSWMVSGGLAALGFLAKGPVAWIPAGVVALAILAARSDRKEAWQRLQVSRSVAFAALIVLPWVGLLLVTHGGLFFYEFFVVHNLGRYAGGLSNTQSSSVFYYLIVVLVGFFPWSMLLPVALPDALRSWKRNLGSLQVGRALPALCAVSAVFYIAFFSVSQTKLAHYIVPAYPALAIVAGWWMTRANKIVPQWLTLAGGALALALGSVALLAKPLLEGMREDVARGIFGWVKAIFNFEWPLDDAMAMAVLRQDVGLGWALPVLGLVVICLVTPLWMMAARQVKAAFAALCITWAACLALIAWSVVPLVWDYTQAPLARLAGAMVQYPAELKVVHLGLHKPSVLYMTGRPFVKLEKPLQLPEQIGENEVLVLTEEESVPAIQLELATQAQGTILAKTCDGGYCLLVVARVNVLGAQ